MQAGVQVAQCLLHRVKLAAVTVGGVGGQGGFIKGNALLLPPFVKLRGDAAGVGRAVGTAGLRIYVGAGAVSARRGQIGQLDQCAAVTIKVKQQLAAVCSKLSGLRLPVCDLGYNGRQPLQFGPQGITVLRVGAGIPLRRAPPCSNPASRVRSSPALRARQRTGDPRDKRLPVCSSADFP